MTDNEPVITTTEARQATRNRLNLRVLLMGLFFALLAALVLYGVFYGLPGLLMPDLGPGTFKHP